MRRLVICIFLAGNFSVFSQNPLDIIREANEAYSRSEYSHAIELYEQVLAMDLAAPELYYNLGNAYFKNNRIGRAVLNYERANRLNPSNDNIIHNLNVARSRLVDRVEQRPLLFYERWWRNAYMMQSASGWGITAVIFLFFFFSVTSVYLFSRTRGVKKTAFYTGLLLLLITGLSFIFAQKQYNRLMAENEAIIMSPRVSAKSSPSQQSPDLFLVHEGTRVIIRNSLGEWVEIGLTDGNVGWVKKETLEVI